MADTLGVTYDKGKTLRHGLRYGLKPSGIVTRMKLSESRAYQVYNEYQQKYAATFNFVESLKYMKSIKTPILGREIKFSEFKRTSRMSLTIQGSCVDLLLLALAYIFDN
jgi:DNA polymerase I-like protein with 3'-5' exonuclease and polymerase domains